MKKLLYLTTNRLPMLLPMLLLLLLTSCDVHEFPDVPEPKPTEIDLRLIADVNFLTPFDGVNDITRSGMGAADNAVKPTRLIIEAYEDNNPGGELLPADIYNAEPCFRQVLPLDDAAAFSDTPVELRLTLGPRAYVFLAWADYCDPDSGEGLHYTADRLHSIRIRDTDTYPGNTETKDAFSANKRVDFSRYKGWENAAIEERITLTRPFARYEIIARDVEEFLQKREGGTKAARDLSSYHIEVSYRGFFPCEYNVAGNKPSDAVQGIAFSAPPADVTETSATLAFDYVLVNGSESSVTADILIYDENGSKVSETCGIRIPYKRNVVTRIYGDFLTRSYNSGVGIDPDYDGEYDIYL